jgi:hypothetical protein
LRHTRKEAGPLCAEDFIIESFCRVDERVRDVRRRPQATLCPGERVTLALVFAFKGGSGHAFYRRLKRDWLYLFPGRPDRTRLFRLFATHADWTERFMAEATLPGVADTYGIELVHPAPRGPPDTQVRPQGP